jgi:2-polyprenyl-3-methyl-5-hydroxy-6-metoxy-1,4-benzoquinol methylase
MCKKKKEKQNYSHKDDEKYGRRIHIHRDRHTDNRYKHKIEPSSIYFIG